MYEYMCVFLSIFGCIYVCMYMCVFWVAVLTPRISQPVMTSTIFKTHEIQEKTFVVYNLPILLNTGTEKCRIT